MNLGVAADSGLTVLESTYFQSRKHGAFVSVGPTLDLHLHLMNQLHGEEHNSVPVYLILSLLGLPQTHQLMLILCGH